MESTAFKLNFDESEIEAVVETLRSGWITMGQRALDFEAAFAKELGHGSRCLAVSNGTAALHVAVLALGITTGDEVIVPSLTFIADINSVKVSGGVPVLADVISMADWSMDPADIEKKSLPAPRRSWWFTTRGTPARWMKLFQFASGTNWH